MAARRVRPVLVALVYGAALACAQQAEQPAAVGAEPSLGCSPRLEIVEGRPHISYNADECSATGQQILDSIALSIQAFAGDQTPDDLAVDRLGRLLRREFYTLGLRKRDIEEWISRAQVLEVFMAELAAETNSNKASAAAERIASRQLAAGRDALDEWISELATDPAATQRLRSRAYAARARVQELQDQSKTALPWWERALEAAPGDVEFRLERARILTRLRRNDDALAAYMELLDEDLTPPARTVAFENVAFAYVAKGMNGAATSALRQALEIREALAQENPAKHRPSMARLHHGLGARYRRDGDFEKAVLELEQAVALYRESTRESKSAYQQELADVLWTAAMNYSSVKRLGTAGTAVTEAIAIYEEIARDVPDVSTPGVPQALTTLAAAHLQANHAREAVYYLEEAVRILRAQLKIRDVYWVRPSLATSLSLLGDAYRVSRRSDKALAALDEALAINRGLAAAAPGGHHPALAQTLNRKGVLETAHGRHAEAELLFRESADLYRSLSDENRTGFRKPLAGTLRNRGAALAQIGEWKTAAEAVAEAADIQESLYEERPQAEAEDLFNVYVLLASVQHRMQDCPTALLTLARARRILGADKRALELKQIEQRCALERL